MPPARSKPDLVSVVIPVRNSARTLTAQLEAVAAQDYAGAWEVVVADNGSRDASRDVASVLLTERGGRLVDASPRRGPGHARNAGARAARGDFLAFCDADDVVSPGWLGALVAAAVKADIVTGPQSAERLNDAIRRSCNDVEPADKRFHGFLPIATGGNCGVWSDVFYALGGFDEACRAGEDVAFSWRAQLSGYSLAVAEGALVHKRFRPGYRAMARQFVRYGMGDAWLFSRFWAVGMPRRSLPEAAAQWREIARGLPSLAGTSGQHGRVVQMAALSIGRIAGSISYGKLFP